jgi:hypothetical protein
MKEAYIEIYISESDHPPLDITEELCTKIGHIEVKIPTSKILTEIKISDILSNCFCLSLTSLNSLQNLVPQTGLYRNDNVLSGLLQVGPYVP